MIYLQGGSGIARNIVFEDILMRNVHNPIIINQYYCDKNKKCDKEVLHFLSPPFSITNNFFVFCFLFCNTYLNSDIYENEMQKSAVQVENVAFRNIRGTSASKVAINLNCSESVPCKNVVLQNVLLTAQQKGEKVEAACNHLAMQTTKLNSLPSCSLNN